MQEALNSPEILVISLSAFLASLGYVLQIRGRRLETRRHALFFLFEMRRAALQALISPDEAAKEINDILKAKMIEKFGIKEADIPDTFSKDLYAHLGNMSEAATLQLDEGFQNAYKTCLYQLSKEAPYSASYLMGNERLGSIFQVQKQYVNSVTNNNIFQNSDTESDYMTRKIGEANKVAIQDIISDVDKDIKWLSWNCGFLLYLDSLWTLRKKEPIKQDIINSPLMNKIDDLFDEIVKKFSEE